MHARTYTQAHTHTHACTHKHIPPHTRTQLAQRESEAAHKEEQLLALEQEVQAATCHGAALVRAFKHQQFQIPARLGRIMTPLKVNLGCRVCVCVCP
jgi:hypothetical protein